MYIRVRSVYIRVQRDPLTHHMFLDARAELPTRTDNRWPFHFQEIRLYFPRNLSGQQAFSTVSAHYQQDPVFLKTLVFFF
jgi:hypothetical protein